jgi:hypothetical protein
MSEIENAEESKIYADIEAEITGENKESAPSEVEVTEPETEVETETDVEIETEVEPDKPKSDGVQKRINKLTGRVYSERAKREEAERKLAEFEKKPELPEKAPTLEDFDFDEDLHKEALIKYSVDAALSERDQKSQSQTIEDQRKEASIKYNKRVEESGIGDEIKEASLNLVDAKIPISMEAIDAIYEDENGPLITKYLGNNLDKVEELSNMSPLSAVREIGKLSVKLSTVKPKKTTKAPAPVKIAGSGGTASVKDIGDKDADHSLAELDKILYD